MDMANYLEVENLAQQCNFSCSWLNLNRYVFLCCAISRHYDYCSIFCSYLIKCIVVELLHFFSYVLSFIKCWYSFVNLILAKGFYFYLQECISWYLFIFFFSFKDSSCVKLALLGRSVIVSIIPFNCLYRWHSSISMFDLVYCTWMC